MKKVIKKIIFILIVFLIIISPIFIFVSLQIALKTKDPIAVIGSNSMEPYLKKGDVVIIKGINENSNIKSGTIEDKEGDVIAFDASELWEDAPEDPIVHRVVGKYYNDTEDKYYFITKGDSNDVIDKAPIPQDNILGVVKEKIPYIGLTKIILLQIGFLFQFILFLLIIAILIKKLFLLKL